MIARHRGATRIHSRWQPPATAAAAAAAPPAAVEPERAATALPPSAAPPQTAARRSRRAVAGVIVVVGGAAIGYLAASDQTPVPSLPGTPAAWVKDWTAAVIEDPGRVCGQLYAPALAAALKPMTGSTCRSYYRNTETKSFRVRRIIEDGNAASVEAREVGARPTWGYVTFLLSHGARGWRAVDIVPGAGIRTR